MFAGGAYVFARFDSLIGKSLSFSKTDPFDCRLIPIGGKVTRHRDCSNLFAEKAKAQRSASKVNKRMVCIL